MDGGRKDINGLSIMPLSEALFINGSSKDKITYV
jgi:hypothetical protein